MFQKKQRFGGQIVFFRRKTKILLLCSKHFKTFKFSKNNITVTGVTELSHDDRVEEVATMISGDKITEEARQLSKKLLHN